MNPILNTDSYKASHYLQYPPATSHVFAYVESRGGLHPHTLFFGLQAILKREFLRPVTLTDIAEASELLARFEAHELAHVRREFNTDADALVNAALDAAGGRRARLVRRCRRGGRARRGPRCAALRAVGPAPS